MSNPLPLKGIFSELYTTLLALSTSYTLLCMKVKRSEINNSHITPLPLSPLTHFILSEASLYTLTKCLNLVSHNNSC